MYKLVESQLRRQFGSLEAAPPEWKAFLQEVQALYGALPDLHLRIDWDGTVLDFLGGDERDLVAPPEALVGRRAVELLPAGPARALMDALEQAKASGAPVTVAYPVAARERGEQHYEARVFPTPEGHALVVVRNTTELNRSQARLVAADRMAALGTLAAGVGHEINNPLAYVIANVEMVLTEWDRNGSPPPARLEEMRQALREARDGAERVRDIVRDLRTFSRADETRGRPLKLEPLMESTLRVAGNEILQRAGLVKEFGPAPLVEGTEARLGQVFLNLIMNAAQAIPEGAAERNEIRVRIGADPAGRAVVEVRDTGSGIAPDHLAHIFDPFFTTRAPGEGAGLGLSICHTIVSAMGGELSVESELGRGSTFRVVLPPATGAGSAERPDASRSPETAGRRRRILVVDDEPLVGMSVSRLLGSEHEVVAVTRARDALARLGAGEHFDLVLCDLTMPEMSGMDFYAEARRLHAELSDRFIFLTGSAFTPRARAFLDALPNPRLDKPFDSEELRARVRELLG